MIMVVGFLVETLRLNLARPRLCSLPLELVSYSISVHSTYSSTKGYKPNMGQNVHSMGIQDIAMISCLSDRSQWTCMEPTLEKYLPRIPDS